MKKVLFIAYYFPPLGMGGTQRVAKFAKYLPEFDWQPYIITVKNIAYYAYDKTLLNDIANAKVIRTGSLDPQRVVYLFNKFKKKQARAAGLSPKKRKLNQVLNWLFIPDTKILWLPFVLFYAVKIIKRENIKHIITTSPPHSVHFAGFLLKIFFGIKWFADFRDGWISGNFQSEPTFFHRWTNRRLQGLVVNTADRIISVSGKLTRHLSQASKQASHRFLTITNGFDAEDFKGIPQKVNHDKFIIVYSGALTAIAPLDSFFKAIVNLYKSQASLKQKVEVRLIGLDINGSVSELISKLNLLDNVALMGYIEHRAALEQIASADLLLYPVANWASEDFIPGKTFEYMAAGKPVLAIGKATEGFNLLKSVCDVDIAAHSDISLIESLLLKRISSGKASTNITPEKIEPFERKELTKKLTQVLEGVI